MNSHRIILVGPSGAGKTTVGELLARALGLPLISMDAFRFRRKPLYIEHLGRRVRTFEDPALWDENAIVFKLRSCCQAGAGFVAEGNHLLQYPAVRALPGLRAFYLDIPFAESLRRRKARHRGSAADQSFAIIGRGETEKYVHPQVDFPGIVKIDALNPPSTIAAGIHCALESASLPVLR